MADERKKKLEALRKKKAELIKLVQNSESANPPPATQSDPARDTSSVRTETSSSISETSTPSISTNASFRTHTKRNSFLDNPQKNARLLEIHIKKINESLRTSKSEHFLRGIYPELKTEETQYKLPEEFEEEKS